jgi:hypothetical protein
MTEERTIRRTLAVLGGTAALIAALLGLLQVDSSRKSNRAAAEGSRLAVEIFGELTSGGLDLNAQTEIIRDHFTLETEAAAVELLTTEDPQSGLRAVARADTRAAARLKKLWARTIGKPLGFETLPELVAEQAALAERGNVMVARQNAAIAEAERYSRRSSGASRGLLLVATAGALFTLAGSLRERRPAWLALGAGVLVLAGAVATGGFALVA